jgi:uncharacterized protein (TIGR01777 family)
MRILIIGATGFIGGVLVSRLIEKGHIVTAIGHGKPINRPANESIKPIIYDSTKTDDLEKAVADNEVIINLAGASIFRLWSQKGKSQILNSRLLTTQNIVKAIAKWGGKKRQLISVSGVGYYGSHEDEILAEDSANGSSFLARVAAKWELKAMEASRYGTRVVICRLGHVLGMHGGMLPKLITLSKFHLGARWGNGKQWVSWVHIDDVVNLFLWLIERNEMEGVINVTSPNPVRNLEMMECLRKAVKSRTIIPYIPGLLLKLIVGEFASVFLTGQRVIPRRLLGEGYIFIYPKLTKTIDNLLH